MCRNRARRKVKHIAFTERESAETDLRKTQESRLKAGCSQDWPPHTLWIKVGQFANLRRIANPPCFY